MKYKIKKFTLSGRTGYIVGSMSKTQKGNFLFHSPHYQTKAEAQYDLDRKKSFTKFSKKHGLNIAPAFRG